MPELYEAQAIIFDLDGTLVDSAEDLRATLNVLLRRLGLREIEPEEVKKMIGDGVPKLIERGLTAAGGDPRQAASLIQHFIEIYEMAPTVFTRCYDGVVETLMALRSREFRLAVVTNKPVAVTIKILCELKLADFFEVVIGGDSLPQRKPDPRTLLEAARQLGLDVGQLLVVGDNKHDIDAAHAANIRSIAVTYGYHHQPPSTFNADRLIDRLDELLPLVRSSAERGDSNADDSTHTQYPAPESRQ